LLFSVPEVQIREREKLARFSLNLSPFNPQVHQRQEKAFPQKSGVAGAG
jgi:hypothetical protein